MINNIDKFEDMAFNYDQEDRINDTMIIVEEIKKHIMDTNDKVLLDYGCGTGLVGLNLVDDFKQVILVDPSSNMIEVVNNKIIKNNIMNAKAKFLDISLNKLNYQVDYIIIVQTLLHINNYQEVLKMLSDCLNNKGHLIIVDFDKNDKVITDMVHNGFNQKELIDYLSSIGLKYHYNNSFYSREKMFMKQDASMFIVDVIK